MSNDNAPTNAPETKKTCEKRVVAEWKQKLASNSSWAQKGLLAVYKYQTEAEKAEGTVKVNNGVGFTGTDGVFLSSLARQLQQRGSLSEKQMQFLFRKMPKYASQLYKVTRAAG